MVKRSRDDASSALQPLPPPHAKRVSPTQPPKRGRQPCVPGGSAEKPKRQRAEGRPQPEANRVAGGHPSSPQAAAGDAPETTAAKLPRWWQLWVGRGGGMAVDYEELLRGWFPFVDEDFASEGEKVEWFSIWENDADVAQREAPNGLR